MMASAPSPPPMFPDDFDDVDDDFAHNGDDDEDEDSASFDLTGMSEKIHSIPREAIQIAPKEVILPVNGFNDMVENSVELAQEVATKELAAQSAFQDATSVQVADSQFIKGETENIGEAEYSGEAEIIAETENFGEAENIGETENIDACVTASETIDPSKPNTPVTSPHPVCEIFEKDTIEEAENRSFEEPESSEEDSEIAVPNLKEPNICSSLFSNDNADLEQLKEAELVLETVEVNHVENTDQAHSDDDFGDFNDPSEVAGVVVPPLNLDQVDEDDDDDFGDFTATDDQPLKSESFASSEGWASLTASPRGKLDQILIGLQLKMTSVIANLFVSLESPDHDVDEFVQPLDFGRDDDTCEDAVWHLVHNIQTTPALNQKWKDTEGRAKLLKYLKIDPKNIHHDATESGMRMMSKAASNAATGVPAFAAGLGMTLQPMKVDELKPVSNPTPNVPSNSLNTISGLKDSKVASGSTLIASTNLQSLLPNEDEFRGTSKASESKKSEPVKVTPDQSPIATSPTKARSANAQSIIDSFPLLDFMQSSTF